MSYEIIKNYQKDKALRDSFNALAEKTFGLNFENWYQNGYWNEKYIPYSILKDGKIISNVSVNLIDCTVGGEEKHYIQLGTVMTDETYRNHGYCRKIMQAVLANFKNCDGIFLYANDNVLDFYPKFGFVKADEYRYCKTFNGNTKNTAVPVPMNDKNDWTNFLNKKKLLTSNGIVKTDTDDLLMFYLSQFMTENVFFIKSLNAYVIAEIDGETLMIYDILSEKPVDTDSVCNAFGNQCTQANFAFVPENTSSLEKYLYQEDDTTFFIFGETLKADIQKIQSFPQLIHA